MGTLRNLTHKKKKRGCGLRNDLNAWILFLPTVIVLYLMIW